MDATAGSVGGGTDASYLLECPEPLRINLDPFHMRVCKEAAASLADAQAAAPPPSPRPRSPNLAGRHTPEPFSAGGAALWGSSGALPGAAVNRRRNVCLMSPDHTCFSESDSRRSMSSEAAGAAEDGEEGGATRSKQFTAGVVCREVSVLLVSSISHSPTPMAKLLVQGLVFAASAADDGGWHAMLELPLQMAHFNRSIAKWEPVLEQCPIHLELLQAPPPPPPLGDERRSGEKEGEAAGGEEAPKGLLDVRLTMVHRLELVLSDNALNALWGAAARVKEAFTATLDELVASRGRPPYRMRNETGVPLSYRKATAAGPLANAQANPIESGVEAPLQLWSSDAVQHTLHCITVGRHGAWETRPLPVASTGTFVVPLMHTRGGGGHGGSGGGGGEHGVGALVARVELADEGSTSLLRLGSLVQLRNCTGTPLEIQVDHEGAVDPEVLPDLAPSASTSVPLHLLHGGVMLRPAPKGRSVTLDSLASSTGSGKDASLRTI